MVKVSKKINEKLAPKLIKKSLNTAFRLLVFIGKPFYFLIIIFPLSTIFYGLEIIKVFLKQFPKAFFLIKPERKIPSKGTIFTSKFLSVKILFSKTKKSLGHFFKKIQRFEEKVKNEASRLVWNTEIFFLATDKLFEKALIYFKNRIRQLELRKKFQKPSLRPSKISVIKFLTLISLVIFLSGVIGAIFFWSFILKDLPSPKQLTKRILPASTKIYDRNGILLYTIYKNQNRTPVHLNQIPMHVRLATIAAEDAEFYSHPGFSLKGILRAIIKMIKEGKITGGSTITQQLVKNAFLSPEKTITRKLKELVLAIQAELAFSKDEILEMYLNEVSYGGTAYGIQEAARTYFNKNVNQLSLGEAALLAGLPQSPTLYSPFGPNPENSLIRQKEVLRRMQENGFITQEQRVKAENETLIFAQNIIPIKAPHFVFYVKEELEKKYGKEQVEQGGLEIITTLDYQIQLLAEKVVKEEVEKLKNLNVTNGAAIVLSPKTGEILAMVGSKDYFDSSIDGKVNVALRPRQPGSSIKIVNYSYALSNGFTPATIIPDTPVTFYIKGQPPYSPKNYDNDFRGNITLRSAFAESRNVPAVKVLATYGVDKMIEMGKKLGITTWNDPKNYGLSLTLGGGEVKLLDLARVYATIANYGRKPEIRSILKVSDYKGRILEEFKCDFEKPFSLSEVVATSSSFKNFLEITKGCYTEQVLDPRIAFLITNILSDNQARAASFGINSLLVIPNHKEVAVKTGTSNNLKDNLAIGYTQNYVVAVWVGNNDNSPMAKIASGITGATPIFNKIMSALLKDSPNEEWPIPPRIVQLPICPYTGTLACEGCPVKMEWFLEENKPKIACSPEWFKEKPLTSENINSN